MAENQSGTTGVALPEDFADQQQAWYKSVAKVFARTMKKDVADIPLDVWKKLVRTTYDGIDVEPLYMRADAPAESPAPGQFPFVRGGQVNDDNPGWGVTETFGEWGSVKEINDALLAALRNGTTHLVLDVKENIGPSDIKDVLADVYLDLAPIRLDAGERTAAAAKELYAALDASDADAAKSHIELAARPLTAGIDSTPSPDLEATIELAKEATSRAGDVRAIMVDAVSFSNQGATDAQEIGFALATGVEYLRKLTDAGLSVEEAFGQLAFRFAVTDDQFGQICKLRAFRELWARVAEVSGYKEGAVVPQHAVTAPVMFSQRDPYVNMLRCTVAAFAGGVGGASDVEVKTFDYALKGGNPGTSRGFAHRIARNTNLLLLEESHLGYVVDPAGGAYFVEYLTQQLADKAWEYFTTVESKGGYLAAAEYIREQLDEATEKVRNDIAHRRKKVTGINEFPNLAEKPLAKELRVEPTGVRRWAAEFESFRNRSDAYLEAHDARPTMGMIPLGPLAKHSIRTGFTANLLASGGIETLNPGQVVPGTEEFTAAAQKTDMVVICGTDAEYENSGEEAVKALREAGVKEIYLAGAPKSFEGKEATPDGYLNMKIDAAKTLDELLKKLGA